MYIGPTRFVPSRGVGVSLRRGHVTVKEAIERIPFLAVVYTVRPARGPGHMLVVVHYDATEEFTHIPIRALSHWLLFRTCTRGRGCLGPVSCSSSPSVAPACHALIYWCTDEATLVRHHTFSCSHPPSSLTPTNSLIRRAQPDLCG